MGAEVFHALAGVLKKRGQSTNVGDEGGFAPNLRNNEEPIEVILEAIAKAGYQSRRRCRARARPGLERILTKTANTSSRARTRRPRSSDRDGAVLCSDWVARYPDRLDRGRPRRRRLGRMANADHASSGAQVQLVGDDLFVTNTKRLERGIERGRRQFDPDQGQPDRHAHRDA